MQVGLSLDEFWQLSTVEFRAICEAWTERRKAEWRRDVTHAWHVAVFVNNSLFGEKGLAPLRELLGDPLPAMTVAQQKAAFAAMGEVMGVKARPANKQIRVIYPKGHPKAA